MANYILSTMGTGGDVFPFIAIGASLRARGHRVTLLTHSQFRDDAARAELNFDAIDSPEESSKLVEDGPLLNTAQGLLSYFERHVLPKIPVECDLIRKHFSPGDTVLVTRFQPGFAARIASEQLQAPLVDVFMAPASALGLPLFEQLVTSLIGPRINNVRQKLGLGPVLHWRSWLRYQTALGLWPDWFCPPDPAWPSGLRLVGFIVGDGAQEGVCDEEIRRKLQDRDCNVLLTAGTGLFGGEDFFDIAVEACWLAGCRPVLVSRHKSLLPPRLPKGCVYLPHVPSLAALMPLMSVVCHHGGMGTLGQAIAAGSPQLVIAEGGDRPDNGARLKQLGVAEFIGPRHRSPDMVAAALNKLVSSESVRHRCQELSALMLETAPLKLVCELLEEAVHTAQCVPRLSENKGEMETRA